MAEPDRKRPRRTRDTSKLNGEINVKLVEQVNALSGLEFFTKYGPSGGECSSLAPSKSVKRTAADISSDLLEQCLSLIESTSKQDYENSEIKWSASKKLKEMKLPDMKYIVLLDDKSINVTGFISFMVTYEDGYEVLYIYEIHFKPEWQGKGVGGKLMSIVEGIGRNMGLVKVMLTVFKANNRAVRWYTKLGYVEDEFSPGPRKLRNGTVKEPNYIILSKTL
ncbi:N alpha-acetyl-transferase [Rhinocladiella similis]